MCNYPFKGPFAQVGMQREISAVDKGSKYCIHTMQSVVSCEMKRFGLEDDRVHAIYGGWEEVSRVYNSVKQWLES